MSKTTNRYVCIHGHFYQPPRENPWLNKVEIQDSAYPFHDWNERINEECYVRNATSRILNHEGKVMDIMNNYAWMSFNIGPTLLAWMQDEAPETYQAIMEADKQGQENFGGHGPALAQAFNHMIMPLANTRDKHTQVIWGIGDFKSRFGREPEGMWLGETAANTETLEVLAEHGIKFTILSPYQAQRFRKMGESHWQDATGAKIDPHRGYLCKLPSGKEINLFFYDGPTSQAVAFEGMLNNGEEFANRILGSFKEGDKPQLANLATDGESYGHHHNMGEMALSYCLYTIREDHPEHITIYGEYLEKFPPEYEVEIIEDTSWSCSHGVERWRSNCGCNTGGHAGWTQEWRAPLREAFDWVREELIALYEQEMKNYTDSPWDVRNAYIRVILDRSEENVAGFLKEYFGENLEKEDQVKLLELLEMQYHAMLMYTSCGWFFDEVTGIESMQDVFYAARAIQLAEGISQKEYEPKFIELLEKIPSNIPEYGNAAVAYNRHVKPTIVNMLRVGAHYAVATLFEDYPTEIQLYSFRATSDFRDYHEAGRQKLVIGRALIKSIITWEEIDVSYAVLHLGDHQLFGGARSYMGAEAINELKSSLEEAFDKGRTYEMLNLMDKNFGDHNYSFWYLFRDDQKKIMERVMADNLKGAEGVLYQLYESNYPLLQVYGELGMAIPRQLKQPVDLAVNTKLINILKDEEIKLKDLEMLLESAQRISVDLEMLTLDYIANEKVGKLLLSLEENPDDRDLLEYIIKLLKLLKEGGVAPEYLEAQNSAFRIRQSSYAHLCKLDDEDSRHWCEMFDELYKNLNLVV